MWMSWYHFRLLQEIRKSDGGLSAYGEEQVRKALMMGAVDTLLLSEGLNRDRVVMECPACGWKGRLTVDKKRNEVKCPECGEEMEEMESADLIDDFFEEAENTGSRVELISEDSEEGEMLMKAFGGIAAILRFRVGD